jgi:glyoxylase-like metal-dependent hydrolase (beta-lactamase superfamily II)
MSDPEARSSAPSWSVGDVKVTRVDEVTWRMPLTWLVPDATMEAISPYRTLLSSGHFDHESGDIPLSFAGFVVETPTRRILVDTCIGPEHQRDGGESHFLDNLALAGFSPESIDTVVCTHFHLDHVGGNTRVVEGVRRASFPNARYIFCDKEWEWASTSMDRTNQLFAAVSDGVDFLVAEQRAEIVSATYRVSDEVHLVPTHGHSPGHVCVAIESGSEQAIITGDAIHHPIQFSVPTWQSNGDVDVALAAKARSKFVGEVANNDVLVIGSHFASPTAGYVRVSKGETSFVPLDG